MDKSLIINEIKLHLGIKTDVELADYLGVSQPTISLWRKRNTLDYDLIISKCNNINGHFLITGKGSINLLEKKEEPSFDKQLEEKSYVIELQKKYIKTLEDQLHKSKLYPETPVVIRSVAEDPTKLK